MHRHPIHLAAKLALLIGQVFVLALDGGEQQP